VTPDLHVKRLEELLDGRLFGSHQRLEPLAPGTAPLQVVAHNLGIVVIHLSGCECNDGSSARLVAGFVVQAHLAKRRTDHFMFKGSLALLPVPTVGT